MKVLFVDMESNYLVVDDCLYIRKDLERTIIEKILSKFAIVQNELGA